MIHSCITFLMFMYAHWKVNLLRAGACLASQDICHIASVFHRICFQSISVPFRQTVGVLRGTDLVRGHLVSPRRFSELHSKAVSERMGLLQVCPLVMFSDHLCEGKLTPYFLITSLKGHLSLPPLLSLWPFARIMFFKGMKLCLAHRS